MPRNKLESITLRVTPEFKAAVVQQARTQNRSITSYLEWLVMQDAARAEEEKAVANLGARAKPDVE
jgi:hypothetical protein